MKITIETLTRIRDHIRNVLLPTAQGKTEGKWEVDSDHTRIRCKGKTIANTYYNDPDGTGAPQDEQDATFIAATSDTAEPAWICVAEEIDELLLRLAGKTLTAYENRRAASIINNWKGIIQ